MFEPPNENPFWPHPDEDKEPKMTQPNESGGKVSRQWNQGTPDVAEPRSRRADPKIVVGPGGGVVHEYSQSLGSDDSIKVTPLGAPGPSDDERPNLFLTDGTILCQCCHKDPCRCGMFIASEPSDEEEMMSEDEYIDSLLAEIERLRAENARLEFNDSKRGDANDVGDSVAEPRENSGGDLADEGLPTIPEGTMQGGDDLQEKGGDAIAEIGRLERDNQTLRRLMVPAMEDAVRYREALEGVTYAARDLIIELPIGSIADAARVWGSTRAESVEKCLTELNKAIDVRKQEVSTKTPETKRVEHD